MADKNELDNIVQRFDNTRKTIATEKAAWWTGRFTALMEYLKNIANNETIFLNIVSSLKNSLKKLLTI
jgi:hypothetical protein